MKCHRNLFDLRQACDQIFFREAKEMREREKNMDDIVRSCCVLIGPLLFAPSAPSCSDVVTSVSS